MWDIKGLRGRVKGALGIGGMRVSEGAGPEKRRVDVNGILKLLDQPHGAVLQKAEERPLHGHPLRQDRPELPRLPRHNINPALAPSVVKITMLADVRKVTRLRQRPAGP